MFYELWCRLQESRSKLSSFTSIIDSNCYKIGSIDLLETIPLLSFSNAGVVDFSIFAVVKLFTWFCREYVFVNNIYKLIESFFTYGEKNKIINRYKISKSTKPLNALLNKISFILFLKHRVYQ